MRLVTRLVWTTSDGSQELLSLDSKIKVHAYEVTPGNLGQLMRAGLVCLRELSQLEDSPLQEEAQRALSEWNLYLPARATVRPAEVELAEAPSAPPAAPAVPSPNQEVA
jgi:hypothetical protein